jgi:glucose/arabinose dehydrogenase
MEVRARKEVASGARARTGRAWLYGLVLALFPPLASACDEDSGFTEPEPTGPATLEVVVVGLENPLFLTTAPGEDATLYVVERPGRIRVVDGDSLVGDPFLDITTLVRSGGEQGLLGLAFHPNYDSNGLFFVNYTDHAGDTRVVRYTVRPDGTGADPASAKELLMVPQPFTNHNGGHLVFGPDGLLYIGLGDGGSGGDPNGNGQDPSTLLGSMLRIDVDGGDPYAIPADNPFAGSSDDAPEVWIYGLRNPWRYAFDPATGDLYVADVGQQEIEEVSVLPAASAGGSNLGWNVLEGTACFGTNTCDGTGTVLPVHEYTHDEGCSITGGYVYRGSTLPELEGRYFFGDFCSGWIRSFRFDGGAAVDVVDHTDDFGTVSNLSSFGEDAQGELYAISLDGTVYRIVPAG